jgi:uncharacterized protein YutE (UPF0331/DUF86 family)
MLADIQSLPLAGLEQFTEERRTIWAAESCLRRALEAMLDLGRHVAAKGLGKGVSEYKALLPIWPRLEFSPQTQPG